MKCDELEKFDAASIADLSAGHYHRYAYEADEVDEAIAELKNKIENVQASMYADVVDANMENRRLKRALWLARAERAKTEHLSKIMYSTLYRDFIAKWVNVERKCRAKAEQYR